MRETITPWWVRAIGGLVLIGLGLGATLIVARYSPDDRRGGGASAGIAAASPVAPDTGPGRPPETGTPFSAERIEKLGACIEAEQLSDVGSGGSLYDLIVPVGALARPHSSVIREVAYRAGQLRALPYRKQVKVHLLPQQRLARRLLRPEGRGESKEFRLIDHFVYQGLGIVPPGPPPRGPGGTDESLLGFYDPRSNGVYVADLRPRGRLSAREKVILAHEFTHALDFQNSPILREERGAKVDQFITLSALVEGSATFVEERFSTAALDAHEELLVNDGPNVYMVRPPEGAAHYQRQESFFPYFYGLAFICDVYASRGQTGINKALSNPPTDTAQIFWPSWYLAGKHGVDVRNPGDPGPRWNKRQWRAFGPANLMWLFQAPGFGDAPGLSNAAGRVETWRGGELHLWTHRGLRAIGLVFEQKRGTDILCQSVEDWYSAAFPNAAPITAVGDERAEWGGVPPVASLVCKGKEVRLGIGPSFAEAHALVE